MRLRTAVFVALLAGAVDGPGNSDGVGAKAQFSGPIGVADDGAGNLYVADTGNDTLRKIVVATGTVTTLAGVALTPGSSDGIGDTARFNQPSGLAYDGVGVLYVGDTDNSTIRAVDVASGAVTTLAGSPGNTGLADGTGSAAQFAFPTSLALDDAGRLYVADGNHTIRAIDLTSAAVTTLAGTPGVAGDKDGTGAGAAFEGPSDLVYAGGSQLYVADGDLRLVDVATGAVTSLTTPGAPANNLAYAGGTLFMDDSLSAQVNTFTPATQALTVLAGTQQAPGDSDGLGAAARFAMPRGLAYDGIGTLLLADQSNDNIRAITVATGAVVTLAGPPGGSADGTGAAARFDLPQQLALDATGTLYVADQGNQIIRAIDVSTGATTTLAGTPGQVGSADGTGAAARFFDPEGLIWDGAGRLYVADTGNGTIRVIEIATGAVTTLAGLAGFAGTTDGVGAAARFTAPLQLAYDGAATLYVSEAASDVRTIAIATGAVTSFASAFPSSGNFAGLVYAAGDVYVAVSTIIYKIATATGLKSAFAGSIQSGNADGTGGAARFGAPRSLIYDGASSLYVADPGNGTIRKISLATGAVSTVAFFPMGGGVVGGSPIVIGPPGPAGLALGPGPTLFISDVVTNTIYDIR